MESKKVVATDAAAASFIMASKEGRSRSWSTRP